MSSSNYFLSFGSIVVLPIQSLYVKWYFQLTKKWKIHENNLIHSGLILQSRVMESIKQCIISLPVFLFFIWLIFLFIYFLFVFLTFIKNLKILFTLETGNLWKQRKTLLVTFAFNEIFYFSWDLVNLYSNIIKQNRDHRVPIPTKGNGSTLVGIPHMSVGHVLFKTYFTVILGTQLKVTHPKSV